MEFIDVIKSRKSVRTYSDKPLDDIHLQTILEAGRNAPSFQNRQCWRFVVINDKNKIKYIASNSGIVGKINFFIKNAPILIVACANPAQSGNMNGQNYYLVDTAIALQQMMLTAWNLGIGSCWMAAFNEEKVKSILSIPPKIRIVAMSPFGYPKEKENIYGKMIKVFAASDKRKKQDKIICYNEWTL